MATIQRIAQLLQDSQTQLLADWMKALRAGSGSKKITDAELQAQCQEFIALLRAALATGNVEPDSGAWKDLREFLTGISRSRAQQGFTPSETAAFVLSFKGPLLAHVQSGSGSDAPLLEEVLELTFVLDQLALVTTEAYQAGREEIILRQRDEMLELSTPVIQLWDGILALPIIGTLDSSRTQIVMESLLQQIVATRSPIAILDITGVPTVDTLTAQHLLKTVAAARLMGAECIISGIRPQIAQTIVHLGVDLGDVKTKASLADAFRVALQRLGHDIQTHAPQRSFARG